MTLRSILGLESCRILSSPTVYCRFLLSHTESCRIHVSLAKPFKVFHSHREPYRALQILTESYRVISSNHSESYLQNIPGFFFVLLDDRNRSTICTLHHHTPTKSYRVYSESSSLQSSIFLEFSSLLESSSLAESRRAFWCLAVTC